MARYAEGTTVSAEVSQAEVRAVLARHGVNHFAMADNPQGAAVQFIYGGLPYRFEVTRPSVDELRAEYQARRRSGMAYELDYASQAEREWKRRWRARLLWLKATLEFAAGEGEGETSRMLLPFLVLPDGQTLEHWTSKQLPDAFAKGVMPPLQLTGGKR